MPERDPLVSRLLIAHFENDLPEGHQFEDWPLHITLLPWLNANESYVAGRIEKVAEDLRACRIISGPRALGRLAMFGPGSDVRVRIIKDSTALGVMHGMLLGEFHQYLEDKNFIGGYYNPHMTIRDAEDPGKDYKMLVDSLSVVRYEPKNRSKTLINKLNLKGSTNEN